MKEAISWQQASVACRRSKSGIAAQLASIHSKEELAELAGMAKKGNVQTVWVGMQSREDIEGGRRMVWSDGSPNDHPLNWWNMVVLFWTPNDACAQMHMDGSTPRFTAAACDQVAGAQGFVCKSRGVERGH